MGNGLQTPCSGKPKMHLLDVKITRTTTDQQQQQQQHSTQHHYDSAPRTLLLLPTLGLSIDTGRLSVFLGGSLPLTEDAADGVIATRGLVLPLPTPTLADARVPMLPMLA